MRNEIDYTDCFAESQTDFGAGKRRARESPAARYGRPRERMADKGPQALSDSELLAVVLNTGTKGKNVSELARELLRLLEKSGGIPSVEKLSRLSGMGSAKAGAVAAMLEFGRRRWGGLGMVAKHPSDLFSLIRHHADKRQERFVSVSLNGAHEVVSVRVVTVGLVNRTVVHPREVFADIIQDRAVSFAVAHNHPSGRLVPSGDDDEITERLSKAARILGIGFLDHLVFSQDGFYSYRLERRPGLSADESYPYEEEEVESELMALLEKL